MSDVFYSPRRVGDIIVRESDYAYGRDSVLLGATAAMTITDRDPIGQFAKANGDIAVAGDEGDIVGIIVEGERLPESMTLGENLVRPHAVLKRGEVVVNKNALPTEDPEGAAFNMTTVQTTLEGLGFVVITDPTVTEVQNT